MELLPDSIISHGVQAGSGEVFSGVCRICGPTRFRSFAIKHGFHLDRCQSCDAVQITDDLSNVNLQDYYGKDFFDHVYMPLQQEGRGRRKERAKFNYRLGEIEKLKPEKGKILDVGCSFGLCLDVARSRGWQPVGIDIGEYAVTFAREEFGLEAYVSDLRNAPMEDNVFDAMTMWNVVEHLDDPVGDLGRANALLNRGGILAFTTGDVGSYMRRLQGLKWRAFIPPVHIVNYNMKAITKLLEMTGFSVRVRSVALPREAVLKQLGLIGLLKGIRFSDKMLILASKDSDL